MMSVGAKGLISVLSNIRPKQTLEMIRACQHGDFEKAGRMQVALMHPLDVHDIAVTLNADSRALRSHWFVRENGTLLESSRGLSGIDEIKQLFGAKTLTVDTGTDNAAGKLTFNIDGLARVIAPLRDACHWAGE